MTKLGKIVLGVIGAGAILGTLAFFNITPFHDAVEQLAVGSPAGTTFSTAKYYGIAAAPAAPGANATSSSILNTDAGDRFVTGIAIGCENIGTSKTAYTGAGLAAFTLSIATTTTAAPASLGTNFLVPAITIGTSTGFFGVASSTMGNLATTSVTGQVGVTGVTSANFVWAVGTYMTFAFNATNTATCTVGVNSIGS